MIDRTYCTTCGCGADNPYRWTDAFGVVVAGCVDSAHNDHADAWHLRPEAAQIRQVLDAYAAECAASLARSYEELGR